METDYTALAELVFKSGRYPEHLVVTRGVRDYQTGHYIPTIDQYGTVACIELAMRMGEEKGLKPFESVYQSNPDDFKHVYKQPIAISADLVSELETKLEEAGISESDFCEYMKTHSLMVIDKKDWPKALNAIETIKKARK